MNICGAIIIASFSVVCGTALMAFAETQPHLVSLLVKAFAVIVFYVGVPVSLLAALIDHCTKSNIIRRCTRAKC